MSRNDSKAAPYIPKSCQRCGRPPKLEHHFDEFGNARSRMRCTGCDRRTRWQAQTEWDEVTAC